MRQLGVEGACARRGNGPKATGDKAGSEPGCETARLLLQRLLHHMGPFRTVRMNDCTSSSCLAGMYPSLQFTCATAPKRMPR